MSEKEPEIPTRTEGKREDNSKDSGSRARDEEQEEKYGGTMVESGAWKETKHEEGGKVTKS